MPSIGRKWTLILLAVPLILGWICLLIPAYKIDIGTPALFYIGRILTGLGGGGFALAPNVYIAEASILHYEKKLTKNIRPTSILQMYIKCSQIY